MTEKPRQLQPKARELAEQMEADLEVIAAALAEIHRHSGIVRAKIRANVGVALDHLGYTEQELDEANHAVAALKRRITEEMVQLLRRRASLDAEEAAIREQLAVMQRNNEAMEALLRHLGGEPSKILPFSHDRPA